MQRILFLSVQTLSLLVVLIISQGDICHAQPQHTPALTADENNTSYLFAGLGAFIPSSESYRINFSNSLAGLPIEISGGLMVPIGRNLFVPLTVRYDRRTANFINGMSVEVTSLEPGVRYFFSKIENKELRIFGGVEGLLANASVSGTYDVTSGSSGIVSGTALAGHDYYNLGMGIDLGLSYPLTTSTALDAMVHVAYFFGNPVSNGGLGNIGGFSLTADYRFGF